MLLYLFWGICLSLILVIHQFASHYFSIWSSIPLSLLLFLAIHSYPSLCGQPSLSRYPSSCLSLLLIHLILSFFLVISPSISFTLCSHHSVSCSLFSFIHLSFSFELSIHPLFSFFLFSINHLFSSFSLSIHLPLSLCHCLSIHQPFFISPSLFLPFFISLSLFLVIHTSAYLSLILVIYPSASLFLLIHSPIFLSFLLFSKSSLSLSLVIYMSAFLSFSPSLFLLIHTSSSIHPLFSLFLFSINHLFLSGYPYIYFSLSLVIYMSVCLSLFLSLSLSLSYFSNPFICLSVSLSLSLSQLLLAITVCLSLSGHYLSVSLIIFVTSMCENLVLAHFPNDSQLRSSVFFFSFFLIRQATFGIICLVVSSGN
ncbi:unnamed protein product [Acanthosepion pharaonis]|uniref:Uncharacterized protein n=1 Tax=Acanthosepion pharaonis TaxID=158019 RepID=A0A812D654_ACAPH|nr:unnamed protein product [Sepia pharaonis]